MNKPYHMMTAAERLAYRIETNRLIDSRTVNINAAKAHTKAQSRKRKVVNALATLMSTVPVEDQKVLAAHLGPLVTFRRCYRGIF
jgi:hypothetical protein